MNKRVDELSDEEAVDMSPDMLRAAKEAEAAAKRAKGQGEDDDNDDDEDDFDLLEDDGSDDDPDTSGGDEDDPDSDDDPDEDDPDEDGLEDDDDHDGIARVPKVAKGKKSKKTAQDRIEELAEKRRDAEAAQFAAEMAVVEKDKAIENLTARLEALEQGGGKGAPAEKPDPSNFEYGEVDQKYIDAVVDWRVAVETGKLKKQQTDALTDAEKDRLIKHYQTASNKAEAEGAKKYGDKFDVVKRTPFSGEVARAVLDSDHPVDISYYLARNVGKLRELTKMDSAQRAKALGRLEERFSARTSAAKKRTKAPDTPGRKAKPRSSKVDSKYGPEDQDEFDKAFWGL